MLLLADVFENFRSMGLSNYGLDPAQYYTLPGYSSDACLKYTKVELTLLRDPEMHLFFENAIRGGISVINHRLARANNEFVPEYNADLDKSYVALFDANNLYGWAMSKRLPTKNFKFLGKAGVESLTEDDLTKLEDEGDVGYVLDVDLFYPDELHVKHNDYP